jgi:hypothetical protein
MYTYPVLFLRQNKIEVIALALGLLQTTLEQAKWRTTEFMKNVAEKIVQ